MMAAPEPIPQRAIIREGMMALLLLSRRRGGSSNMKIAYQGEPGAYSEAASRQLNPAAQLLACKSFEDVFEVVASGPANYGVLPIENSIGGSIHRNFDLLLDHQLPIVGEDRKSVV